MNTLVAPNLAPENILTHTVDLSPTLHSIRLLANQETVCVFYGKANEWTIVNSQTVKHFSQKTCFDNVITFLLTFDGTVLIIASGTLNEPIRFELLR
jgi:hypothetical protein